MNYLIQTRIGQMLFGYRWEDVYIMDEQNIRKKALQIELLFWTILIWN